jgi:hypothetical protein
VRGPDTDGNEHADEDPDQYADTDCNGDANGYPHRHDADANARHPSTHTLTSSRR